MFSGQGNLPVIKSSDSTRLYVTLVQPGFQASASSYKLFFPPQLGSLPELHFSHWGLDAIFVVKNSLGLDLRPTRKVRGVFSAWRKKLVNLATPTGGVLGSHQESVYGVSGFKKMPRQSLMLGLSPFSWGLPLEGNTHREKSRGRTKSMSKFAHFSHHLSKLGVIRFTCKYCSKRYGFIPMVTHEPWCEASQPSTVGNPQDAGGPFVQMPSVPVGDSPVFPSKNVRFKL